MTIQTLMQIGTIARLRAGLGGGLTTIVDHSTLNTAFTGYWNANYNWVDLSGNGNNGTVSGATYTSSGPIVGAGDFDGINDYVDISDGGDYNFESTSDNFGISLWFKFDDLARNNWLLDKRDANNDGWLLGWFNSGQRFGFLMDNSDSFSSNDVVVDNNWHHLIVNVDRTGAGVVSFILDGSDISNTQPDISGEAFGITNTTMRVGMDAYGSSNMIDGKVAEIGIAPRIFTSQEILDLYNSASGLPYSANNMVYHATLMQGMIAHYGMEDANDALGNYDLTVTGATVTSGGIIGDCYDLSGTSSNRLEYADLVPMGADFSFVIWGARPSYVSGAILLGLAETPSSRYIYVEEKSAFSNRLGMNVRYGTTGSTNAQGFTVSDDTYFQAIVMHDHSASATDFYIDNSLIGSTSGQFSSVNGTLIVGNYESGTLNWEGKADLVTVFSRTLTSDEKSFLFNSGAGRVFNT